MCFPAGKLVLYGTLPGFFANIPVNMPKPESDMGQLLVSGKISSSVYSVIAKPGASRKQWFALVLMHLA